MEKEIQQIYHDPDIYFENLIALVNDPRRLSEFGSISSQNLKSFYRSVQKNQKFSKNYTYENLEFDEDIRLLIEFIQTRPDEQLILRLIEERVAHSILLNSLMESRTKKKKVKIQSPEEIWDLYDIVPPLRRQPRRIGPRLSVRRPYF